MQAVRGLADLWPTARCSACPRATPIYPLLVIVIALAGGAALAGTTERISVARDGAQANRGKSHSPSLSADGRYVAFASDASDLVCDDTNGASDIFVHDRQTGQTERASVASDDPAPPGRGLAMAAASPDEDVLKEEDVRGKRAREKERAREHTEEDELLDALYADAARSLTVKAGGVCYAPVGSDEGSGFGAEFYRVRRDGRLVGGALWFAGSLKTPDVDVPIPHQDFTRRGYDSRWGLLYLFGRDDGRTAVIGGVGPAIVQVQYIDRSNVTGWTWDGGSRTVLGLQCQFGLLVHTGRRSAFRLGWDSQFGGFGGLALRF